MTVMASAAKQSSVVSPLGDGNGRLPRRNPAGLLLAMTGYRRMAQDRPLQDGHWVGIDDFLM